MIILDDLVSTATRFNKWTEVQACVQSDAAQAAMQAARRNFGGARYVPLDDSVFFEEIVDDNDLMPIRYFELGRIASRAVGRIYIDLGSGGGQGYATGFLVAPGVLLTNWHVLKTPAIASAATVSFDAEDDVRGFPRPATVFEFAPDTLFVSDEALDFAFVGVAPVAVDHETPVADFGYLRLFPQTGKITRDEYATVIQHPGGRQKQVAVRNNQIVVYVYDIESDAPDNHYLYYRTDTLAGSSGSPVLSDQFFVVALHRRGVPKTRLVDGESVVLRKDGGDAKPTDPPGAIDYFANEGVRVSSILKRLAGLATNDPKVAAAQVAVLSAAGTIRDGPFAVPVAPFVQIGDGPSQAVLAATGGAVEGDGDELEIVRRSALAFANAPGYDATWLAGHPIPLPTPTAALARKLAPRTDRIAGHVLPFNHFSTAVHALRRMPVYAAVNIDGRSKSTLGAMPARPTWSYDPRISDEHQMDDTLFSQMLQRGHMAARDFVYWGADVAVADLHSFTLSNVCPQIAAFNGNKEWSKLERNIVTLALTGPQRVSVLMGPVLDANDPLYDDLRSVRSTARKGTGIRIPRRFWYIVAWVDGGRLQVRPYLLDQGDDLRAAGKLEVDLLKPELVVKTTVTAIERLTGLRFAGLDPHA